MATTPLSQAVMQGMDPNVYRPLSDISQGNAMLEQGLDASPTSKWGAIARLANAGVGTWLSNSATSDLAKTIAGGKKKSMEDILAAIGGGRAAAIPSAPPVMAPIAPASRSVPPVSAPAAAAPVAVDPSSPNAQVASRFPAEMSPGSAASPLPADVQTPIDTAQWPAGPNGAPTMVADASAPRGIRNNNPLNIEAGDFTKGQPGFAGSDGRFAKFETPEHGVAAASKLLDVYEQKHGLNTVAGIVNRWAPPSDGNNTMAYAADVAGRLGIDPNAPVPKEMRPQLIAAMAHHENGRAAPGTDQQPYQVAGPAVAAPKAAAAADDDEVPANAAAAQGQLPQAAAKPSGIDVHRLMAVLQNPYADDTTKQLAQKLLLEHLTPKEDEFASSPQGIYNKRTGEFKQGTSPDETVYGGLSGKELLTAVQQKEPGMAARAVSILEGKSPYPTSSRVNSDDNRLKKIVAQIDPTFEAGTSKARMKMQTDLSSSGNSNMGGILSNGKSSFAHLADASDKMADLGNYNGPNVPGGGHVAAAGNFVGNVVAPSSATKAKQVAVNDNLLKYGQESTKFYAGSGGGEAERMNAMKTLNPAFASSNEQAAFLRTEKGLMIDRLIEKEKQIRDVMGPEYLEKHPVMTPELQAHVKRIDDNIGKLEGTAPATEKEKIAAKPDADVAAPPKAVATKADYDALPSGSSYTAPDGSVRTKK